MDLRKGYFAALDYRILGLCALAAMAALGNAQPFSPGQQEDRSIRWAVAGTDGFCEIRSHYMVESPARSGGSSTAFVDHLEIETAETTSLDLMTRLPPTAVIVELQLAIDVLSSRHGVRLIAEVVLPHAEDPRTGEPLRAVVFGPSYSTPGAWERLELSDMPLQVQRSVRSLQLAVSDQIDARGAYVDRVRLRVRPGRGQTSLRLGQPSMRGAVQVDPGSGMPTTGPPGDFGVRLASGELAAEVLPMPQSIEAPPDVSLEGGVLHVGGSAIFPRAVRYFGGPLRRARELGFNMVILPTTPTRGQEREAQAADLWLIAQPPGRDALAATGHMPPFSRVIAWQLGERLTPVDLDATRDWASQLRRLDPARGRPLLGSVTYGHRTYSRVLDIIVLDRQPLCGASPLQEFVRQLSAECRAVAPGKTIWTAVQTQLPAEVAHQIQCMLRDTRSAVSPFLAADQISRFTWIALAHGAQGLIYDAPPSGTSSELNEGTALELLLLNHQLDTLKSLLVGTGTSRRVVDLGAGLHAGVLSNGRTHCVLPWRYDDFDQIFPPAAARAEDSRAIQASFVVSGIAEPSEAYLMTTASWSRLAVSREAGGVRVLTGQLLPRDALLLTQDAIAAQRLKTAAGLKAAHMNSYERALLQTETDRWSRQGAIAASAAQSLSAQLLGEPGGGVPPVRRIIGSDQLPADEMALRNARMNLVALLRQSASGHLARSAFRSSPVAVAPGLWETDRGLALLDSRPLPTPNLLGGGDFEGLEASRNAGWRHVQLVQHDLSHQIDLATDHAQSGAFCLRISRTGPPADGIAEWSPSGWLASPAVPLQGGDVVRITGWIRGAGAFGSAQQAWAIIDDSLGGEPLALRMLVGPEWQRFVLYRATDGLHELTLRLAAAGTGEVLYDNVAVQRVPAEYLSQSLAGGTRQARRTLFEPPPILR